MAQETTYNTVFETDVYAADNGRPDWVESSAGSLAVTVKDAILAADTSITIILPDNENPFEKGQVFKSGTEYLKVVSITSFTQDTPTAGVSEAVLEIERGLYGSEGLDIAAGEIITEHDVSDKIAIILETTHLIQNEIEIPAYQAGFDIVDPDDQTLLFAEDLNNAAIIQTLYFFRVWCEYLQSEKIKVLSAGEYSDAVFKMIERAGGVQLLSRVRKLINRVLLDYGISLSGQFTRA